MRITLRYFADCPNWRLAEERLRTTLTSIGASDAVVALEPVETHEEAVRLGFRGSPTILVDGQDPFADQDAPVGLACRVYATEEAPGSGASGRCDQAGWRTAPARQSFGQAVGGPAAALGQRRRA